jgi:hypothetical protein
MKIRIGVGAGGACSTTDPLAELVTSLDQLGFDSLWLSEVLISSEHFGVSIGYAGAPIDPGTARMMIARRPRALELTPVGLPALRELIERFIAVGFSKFVVRPVAPPASWRAELEALSAAVGGLQT